MWIPKPGSKEKRPLGIPTVRDRVVQAALRAALEPIFERDFAAQSYGFRPKRGSKEAVRRVDGLMKQGYRWVIDADLKSDFDTIPHRELLERVKTKVSDGRVLNLREAFLKQGVLEEMNFWTPEAGTPQGGVVSPLLSNIYLDRLDHQMAASGIEMVRYADDFVVLCRTQGRSLQATIVDPNRTLAGWFEYFKHSHATTFPTLDGWVRMRLRSILRRRRGGRGRGRGADHQRWPNAYFAERGLFSLVTAHASACQSSRR